MSPYERPPRGLGHYVRDVVYGALDGAITTLAVVAGAVLFTVGAVRARFLPGSPLVRGLEMTVVGALAGAGAFLVGLAADALL